MRLVRGAVVFAATFVLAPAAGAAQRYAAPEGKGAEPCLQGSPCSLKDAITKADTGDEVIVLAGTYGVSQNLYPPESKSNIHIHGDFSGPMPVLSGALAGGVISIFGVKDTLSYLDVTNASTTNGDAIACSFGGEIDRVRATSVGEQANGIEVAGACTIRDSVAISTGKLGAGLLARGLAGGQTTVLRNLTALGSGAESTGIEAEFPGSTGTYTVDAVNTIAAGNLADVAAYEGTLGASRIAMSYSNYDSAIVGPKKLAEVTEGAGNQKGAPSFVDAGAGNFEEAAGSPTIDAGIADKLGPLDLFGRARVVGPAVDIGAYEFVPPAGQIQSLSLAPKTFRALKGGGAILSRKKKAPAGTTVTYSLSNKAQVEFFVERKIPGRLVKGKCKKVTRANRGRKRCAFFRLNKNGFAHQGVTGANRFKFSGRAGEAALPPGAYRLVASTPKASRSAAFRIVK